MNEHVYKVMHEKSREISEHLQSRDDVERYDVEFSSTHPRKIHITYNGTVAASLLYDDLNRAGMRPVNGELVIRNRSDVRLVALTGLAGCGKTTVAQALVDHHGFVRVRFAGPLKAMLRTLGLTEAQVDGDQKDNEARALTGRNAAIVRVWRDGTEPTTEHASEAGIARPWITQQIVNNATVAEAVDALLRGLARRNESTP